MAEFVPDFTNERYNNGTWTSGPDWQRTIGDTFLFMPLPTSDSGYQFDLVAAPGFLTSQPIVGVKAVAVADPGTDPADLFWQLRAENDLGYVSFWGTIEVRGGGVWEQEIDPNAPQFSSSSSGHTYTGLMDLAGRIENTAGYNHALGELELVYNAAFTTGLLTLDYFWFVFYAADGSMVRQWPNDSGGLTVTPRVFPPPRRGRTYGGHH